MDQITALELALDESVLYVYDATLDFSNLNHSAPRILTQGFSGHPRSYKFFTLGECLKLRVEIWHPSINNKQEIVLRDDVTRAVMVPFSVSEPQSGIKISHLLGMVELRFWLESISDYALVFEIKLRDDADYLNSPEYQENLNAGFTEECCYLSFYPREAPVMPQILRVDAWNSPPTFNRYTPVVDTQLIILDDEPTQELRW